MNIRAMAMAFGFAGMAVAAHAGIALVSGDGLLITDPNNQGYKSNFYNDPDPAPVRYWTERTNYLLANDLVVSILPPVSFPTTFNSHSNDDSLKIGSGTRIKSYFLYFDPRNDSVVARFRFDEKIIGLITNERNNAANDHFMKSDYLINPLVPAANIPTAHFGNRGLEIAGDKVKFYADNDIEVDWSASSPGDQMRVITLVPEPGALVALAIGMAALVTRRQRR